MTTVHNLPQYDRIITPKLEDLQHSILGSNDRLVAVDTETTGLKWLNDKAFGVSLAWDNQAVFIRNTDFGSTQIGVLMTELFKADHKVFVFHNAEFDLHMIRETYGAYPPKNILDTLRISHLRNSKPPHGLKELATEAYGPGASAAEDTIKAYIKQYKLKDYSQVPNEFMDPYACMDTVLTKAWAHLYMDEVKDAYPKLFQLEHMLIPIILEMEHQGIKIDLDYIDILHHQYQAEQRSIQDDIYKIVGRPMEVSSPKQLQSYFYDQLGIKPPRETAGGGRSTDETSLQAITHPVGSKVAKLVLRWRSIEKVDTTYVQPYQHSARNSRLHPRWNAMGTITGRFSGSDPNLQNIPADEKVRRIFIPDREFFDFDFSQIELRMMAHASQQQNMIESFRVGTDLHEYTASLIFDVDPDKVDKDQRQIGKRLNFGAIYGGGSRGLARQCHVTQTQAKMFLNQLWTSYPIMKSWIERIKRNAERDGYVKTIHGRKIPVLAEDSFKAPNYLIQGTAGDIIKISLVKTAQYIKSIGGRIRNTVHDQILFDEIDESSVPAIKEIMEDFSFSMPVTVEMKRSKESWGDLIHE